MTTKVEICSDAALLVGSPPISDLSTNAPSVILTSNLFDDVRDNLLRAHPWNFSTKRVKLSPLVGKPPYGYLYEFKVPSDLIRLISIDSDHIGLDFRYEGGSILANASSLNLRYIFRNEDASTWPPDFISAVRYELAAQLAFPITKSDSLSQMLAQRAQYALTIAKSNNALENPSQILPRDPLLKARY